MTDIVMETIAKAKALNGDNEGLARLVCERAKEHLLDEGNPEKERAFEEASKCAKDIPFSEDLADCLNIGQAIEVGGTEGGAIWLMNELTEWTYMGGDEPPVTEADIAEAEEGFLSR